MESKIEIADLVKPKFKPHDEVFLVDFNYNGRLQSIRKVVIDEIRFTVRFYVAQTGARFEQARKVELVYHLLNKGQASEDRLFATAEEAVGAKA